MIDIEMVQLDLRSVGLPIKDDNMGDGTNAAGDEPRDISADFDLLRTFAGWATVLAANFGPGGLFDCADPLVLCGQNHQPIGGDNLVLVGLQNNGLIDTAVQRDGQLGVCFSRMGANKAPDGSGAFGGCDLVLIADLTSGDMFELTYGQKGFHAGQTPGRVRIDGDTALFVIPLGLDEHPRYRAVTFERIPPQVVGGERTDTLPGGPWDVDSFFDVTYRIDVVTQ